ncbi:cytochrome c oxidase subunit 3 [Belliella buryatensis]|uniref:Cytochrome c oxidase subunit 3 n=1 Tax=Belliella buryatensis TaxID=1500549 RepID=A0A239ECN7_9BACT|nr:cytochrome c oxidase subunit 3 [Belliella buryatensis]SNS42396.1 cytochrome c oxidase subunit 3 [Belliella buryatensis]
MSQKQQTWFQKIESMHPYQTLMYLGMFGSGLIFLFLTVAFLASGYGQMDGLGFKMPRSFILSTLVILFSGYTVSKMLLHFKEESIKKVKNSLLSTFFMGLIFTALQLMGWKELTGMGVDFKGLPSGSFLYVLSGIHIFHLIGAMVFALIMVVQYSKREKDQVQHLIMLTNPFEKMRIELFTKYWHFMDFIWLVLFLIFVISF